VNGDGGTARHDAAYQRLVWCGHWQGFTGIKDKRCFPPGGQNSRDFRDLAKHLSQYSQRMAHGYRQHGRAVRAIQQVGVVFLLGDGSSPASASRNQRCRQHLANKSIGYQVAEMFDFRATRA
jgi:hypothetical protein